MINDSKTGFTDAFNKITEHPPYPFQEILALSKELPRYLEIPTGAGKTAAVVMAWLWRRLFALKEIREATPRRLVYCLPMRVLVEQTYNNVQKWLKKLEEHFPEIQPPQCVMLMGGVDDGSFLNSNNKQNHRSFHLYPEKDVIIIGTQDMLLSRALNRGYGSSVFKWPQEFGILNNDCLWVADEVQLMGSGLATTVQLQVFRDVMGIIGTSKTLWMSATIKEDWLNTVDSGHLKQRNNHLALTDEDRETEQLKKRIEAVKKLKKAACFIDEPKKLAKEVIEKHQAGKQTIVVLNTIKRAVELYKELESLQKKEENPVETILLHSHFRPDDREKALNKALKNKDSILISTQVIEAGVDISSRVLFTELAPWASLVQRFGRCNREGNDDEAEVVWIDVNNPDKIKDSECLPYTAEELKKSRNELMEMSQVDINSLKERDAEIEMEQGLVLRKKDLVELFDTTPDLTGMDIDISRFIRETDDFNVQVFWRNFDNDGNLTDDSSPTRKELCPAPIAEIKKLIKENKNKQHFLKWDFLEKQWAEISNENEVFPGMTIMMNSATGHYDSSTGWKKDVKKPKPVKVLSIEKAPPPDYDADRYSQADWQTIAQHTDGVVKKTEEILEKLTINNEHKSQILEAARWHDAGKAHIVFQTTMRKGGNNGEAIEVPPSCRNRLLAKCPHKKIRYQRPAFRHELASGLLALQLGKSDLTAYLATAHHGKVRLSIRSMPGELRDEKDLNRRFARGIWDRERVPPAELNGENFDSIDLGGGVKIDQTEIDLSYMELGDTNGKESWLSRTLKLRDGKDTGPFRLAYYECILRAADVRESGGLDNGK